MKNKNNIILNTIIIIIILFLVIFIIYIKMIKKNKIGNNINSQNIVENILNINYYKAKVTVQINSNKNNNKYILKQEFYDNVRTQEVVEPQNIEGVKITLEDNKIKIENTKLNLSTIYENYKNIENNDLDLISFLENYKENNNSKFEENNYEIIMKTKNKKSQNKILYINKENKKPIKLIVNNDKKEFINIQYNEIELNKK